MCRRTIFNLTYEPAYRVTKTDPTNHPAAYRQALSDGDRESEGNCDRRDMLEHVSRTPDESALSVVATADSSYVEVS